MQIADAMASENLFQPDDPRIAHVLATQFDCSKQYHLKELSLTRVQKGTQAPSEFEYTKTIASVLFRAKAKKIKPFRCSATLQGAHDKI